MLGLVTNHQTDVANNGPGTRFEFLESLPPERRPTHFSYYSGVDGAGRVLRQGRARDPARSAVRQEADRRRLRHAADRRDLGSRAHRRAAAGRASPAGTSPIGSTSPTSTASATTPGTARSAAATSVTRRRGGRSCTGRGRRTCRCGLLIDGGRTIRGGEETFVVTVDPSKPVRLVMRTGGEAQYPYNEPINRPVEVRLRDRRDGRGRTGDRPGRSRHLRGCAGRAELRPAGARRRAPEWRVTVTADAPYRVFHWFALQPD